LPGSAGVFFAVDVGGSSVKSGLVVDGEVEHLTREPVARGFETLVDQLVRLREGAAAPAWGLAIAGLLDDESGTVRYAANLGLREAPIVELLAARGHRPDVFANDLVAATVGEAGGGTLALLQIGTGIAARCAVDGDVPRSAGGQAGEVGHFRFRANGRACRCGNRGCAEAYGAWGGITGRYEEAGRTPASPAALLRQAASGAWARHVLDEALEAVGFAASALVAACDPGTLRVGGGVAAAWGETLLEAIRAALSDQVLPAVAAATVVEGAALGDAAGLVGLAALARR
jgi:glucokinase